MDDLDLLRHCFFVIKNDLEDIADKANKKDKKFALGRVDGLQLAITLLDAFSESEGKKKLLLTYERIEKKGSQ